MARDAHWQALVAMALLEGKIERLHLSAMATGAQGFASAQGATGTWAAVDTDPRLGAIIPKSPRQCHTKGTQPEGKPIPPDPCN